MHNLSSAGVIAFLEDENKTGVKYTIISHGKNQYSYCRRLTVIYNDLSMIINEEENQADALKDCCSLFRIVKAEFDNFFSNDDQHDIRNNILNNCIRIEIGMGHDHCIFGDTIGNMFQFSIPMANKNKIYSKKCKSKAIKATKTIKTIK